MFSLTTSPAWTVFFSGLTGYIGVVVGAIILVYGVFFRWRSTTEGKLFMALLACIEGIVLLVFASYFFGDYPGRNLVRTIVYASTAGVFTTMLIVMIRRLVQQRYNIFELLGRIFLTRYEARQALKHIRELPDNDSTV